MEENLSKMHWGCLKSSNMKNIWVYHLRWKKASFYSIKERVLMKLHGWEKQLLSQASSGVLIKVVAHAITTYTISYFKLPLGLCNDIESLIRIFCW